MPPSKKRKQEPSAAVAKFAGMHMLAVAQALVEALARPSTREHRALEECASVEERGVVAKEGVRPRRAGVGGRRPARGMASSERSDGRAIWAVPGLG